MTDSFLGFRLTQCEIHHNFCAARWAPKTDESDHVGIPLPESPMASIPQSASGNQGNLPTRSAQLSEFRSELLKRLVEVGEASYKESTRIAAVLDDKAQKTSTIAGVFLAAGFAALKPETLTALSSRLLLTLLIVIVVLLMGSVGTSLVAMWVRRNAEPLSIADVSAIAVDVLALHEDELSIERQANVYLDQARVWSECVLAQDRLNARKATFLKSAQTALAAAMFAVGIFLAVLLNSVRT
jgi:hypothetical protein